MLSNHELVGGVILFGLNLFTIKSWPNHLAKKDGAEKVWEVEKVHYHPSALVAMASRWLLNEKVYYICQKAFMDLSKKKKWETGLVR